MDYAPWDDGEPNHGHREYYVAVHNYNDHYRDWGLADMRSVQIRSICEKEATLQQQPARGKCLNLLLRIVTRKMRDISLMSSILLCKRQYLLTCKVSRYCLLALHGSICVTDSWL